MNLIYLHGLDSDANATKGQILDTYCQQHCPEIQVIRPDLNMSPAKVVEKVSALVSATSQNTLLVGSSLGGYFATYLSNQLDVPALLINPSIQPHISLQRFSEQAERSGMPNDIIYTTSGGWQMTTADLDWFANHQLLTLNHPHKVAAIIKRGDELLDAEQSQTFYHSQNALVTMQDSGDHRFSDFEAQLPVVMSLIEQIITAD